MKSFIVALIVALFSVAAQAEQCIIVTKDPRYNVGSYVREQTRCVNTENANHSWKGITRGLLAVAVIRGIIYLVEKNNKKPVQNKFISGFGGEVNTDEIEYIPFEQVDSNKTWFLITAEFDAKFKTAPMTFFVYAENMDVAGLKVKNMWPDSKEVFVELDQSKEIVGKIN